VTVADEGGGLENGKFASGNRLQIATTNFWPPRQILVKLAGGRD